MADNLDSNKKGKATLDMIDLLDSNLQQLLKVSRVVSKTNVLPQKESAVCYQQTNASSFKALQYNMEGLLGDLLKYQQTMVNKLNKDLPQLDKTVTLSKELQNCGKLFERKKPENVKLKYKKVYTKLEQQMTLLNEDLVKTLQPTLEFWYTKCRLNKVRIDKGPLQVIKDINKSLPQIKKAYCTKRHDYDIIGKKRETMDKDNLYDPEVLEDVGLNDDLVLDLAGFTRKFKKEAKDGILFENTEQYLLKRRKKEKKEVDRKATKSRKLKYNVNEKIVNFMTGVENRKMLENRDMVLRQTFGKADVNKGQEDTEENDVDLF